MLAAHVEERIRTDAAEVLRSMTGLLRRREFLTERALRPTLRRRHRGWRRQRAVARLPSRRVPRHPRRGGARARLHRQRRQRPQHPGGARHLQHDRDRAAVRDEPRHVPHALAGARLQRAVQHPGQPGPVPLDRHPAGGTREGAAAPSLRRRHRDPHARRGARGLSARRPDRRRRAAGRRRELSPPGRLRTARLGGLGIRERGGPARRGDPPGGRGRSASTSSTGSAGGSSRAVVRSPPAAS